MPRQLTPVLAVRPSQAHAHHSTPTGARQDTPGKSTPLHGLLAGLLAVFMFTPTAFWSVCLLVSELRYYVLCGPDRIVWTRPGAVWTRPGAVWTGPQVGGLPLPLRESVMVCMTCVCVCVGRVRACVRAWAACDRVWAAVYVCADSVRIPPSVNAPARVWLETYILH